MEQEIEIKIPIEFIGREFDEHLENKNRSRIFFSGKFGSGKTYFLNEFFKGNSKYEVFHLHPVNYQISSNENIIELIKYDILVELFQKYGEELFKETKIDDFLSFSILLKLFWDNNSSNILKNIIGHIPELGRPLQETVGIIEKLINFQKEIEGGEKDIIDKYIAQIKEKDVKEDDFMSEFIRKSISGKKGEKESILILDDLDRIDPDHIFRILNVFSAHFRENNTEIPNKFGFNKIVLVGDIDNIKSIFHHKYGKETDFLGYIDKFYDSEIFKFKNDESIILYMKQKYIEKYYEGGIHSTAYFDSGYTKEILLLLISFLISQENNKYKISLRQLIKGIKIPINKFQDIDRSYDFKNQEFPYLKMGFDGFLQLYGDKNELLESLKRIKIESYIMKNNTSYLKKLSYLTMKGLKLDITNDILQKNKVKLNIHQEYEIEEGDSIKYLYLLKDLFIYYYENN